MLLLVTVALAYISGLLIVNHLLLAWLHSNFPQHLWNFLHRQADPVFTKDDLINAAALRYGGWGDLWSCPLCLGTWIGALVSASILLVVALPWWFLPMGAFSYSGLLYLVHAKLLNK